MSILIGNRSEVRVGRPTPAGEGKGNISRQELRCNAQLVICVQQALTNKTKVELLTLYIKVPFVNIS